MEIEEKEIEKEKIEEIPQKTSNKKKIIILIIILLIIIMGVSILGLIE